jgi:hypothetical protein
MLARVLADPAESGTLDVEGWTSLIAVARAEQLAGTLAHRVLGLPMPEAAAAILAEARAAAEHSRRAALWEAEMARRALAPLACPVVLLKGTAYVAAGLAAGQGRSIGDLDILVPREALDAVEAALLAHGWEWVKPDPYDDAYYRRWMHELPPLIHRERDRMIDVHHTILPLTAGPKPDAAAMISSSVALGNGQRVLSLADMIVHSSAHLFADGDLTGGLRNLWDIHCLLLDVDEHGFKAAVELRERAWEHDLVAAVARALRLAHTVYGTPVDHVLAGKPQVSDRLLLRRLFARDDWGRGTRPLTRFGFYVRGHVLRMPPPMLARHLWTKFRLQRRSSVDTSSSK